MEVRYRMESDRDLPDDTPLEVWKTPEDKELESLLRCSTISLMKNVYLQ